MSTAETDFSSCDLRTDEVARGQSVKGAWHLKNASSNSNFEALIADSTCVVELDDERDKIRFSFYFETENVTVPNSNNYSYKTKTLSLCCTILSGGEGEKLKFVVKLDLLQDDLQFSSVLMSEKLVTIKSEGDRRRKVVGTGIVPYFTATLNTNGSVYGEEYSYNGCTDLRFGITVTRIESTGQGAPNRVGELMVVSSPEVTLAQDLKDMLAQPETFSDVKLETKDGVETSAHKFILAARSPVWKNIIEEECAKESFKGLIKISDFGAKAVIAILHWMYTGRLSDTTGNVIEEVVVAAKKYQLSDMLKQLDKEIITVCNTGNMFQLFEAARQNQMPIAMLQVSTFIKENIGTMVPHA